MKVTNAIGAQLDWMVAKCEGIRLEYGLTDDERYSTDWSQGGPIIEREKIDLFTEKNASESWIASVARYQNNNRLIGWRIHQYGPTPLIAAMRCYVASKLGDDIEIPEELTCIGTTD